MATHFTPDDFIPLDELVQQLSHSCKAAASVFEDLTQDLNATHRFLEDLIKQAHNPESLLMKRCQDRRKDWLHILESLTYALCDLQEYISTYYEVGPEIWLQADDAQRQLNDLRNEVMVGYDAVDTFVDSLGLSPAARKDYSLGQIEKLLVEAMREERFGMGDYGVTEAATGIGGLGRVQMYLRSAGLDEGEIQRHDARTKQLLIWVKQNEPALTEIMERERLATEAERRAKNGEGSETFLESERSMPHTPSPGLNNTNIHSQDELHHLLSPAKSESESIKASASQSQPQSPSNPLKAPHHPPLPNLPPEEPTNSNKTSISPSQNPSTSPPPSTFTKALEITTSSSLSAEEEDHINPSTILVNRTQPSPSPSLSPSPTTSRPSSIATYVSIPSLMEAEEEGGDSAELELESEESESDWEMV